MLDIAMDWSTARFTGSKLATSRRTLGELASFFHDQTAFRQMDPNTLLYEVQSYEPLPDGTEGGLFWGNTTLYPGTVGDEYFMTKGHFHRLGNRGEFYVTCKGQGALLLMKEGGPTVAETMSPAPCITYPAIMRIGSPTPAASRWSSSPAGPAMPDTTTPPSSEAASADACCGATACRPWFRRFRRWRACSLCHRSGRFARKCCARQRDRHPCRAHNHRHRREFPRHAASAGNDDCRAAPECRLANKSCDGIAFGFPGAVDCRTHACSPPMPNSKMPSASILGMVARAFRLPPCSGNDARLALIGEHHAGAARGFQDAAMVLLGTGIGTAVLLNGKPLRGLRTRRARSAAICRYASWKTLHLRRHRMRRSGGLHMGSRHGLPRVDGFHAERSRTLRRHRLPRALCRHRRRRPYRQRSFRALHGCLGSARRRHNARLLATGHHPRRRRARPRERHPARPAGPAQPRCVDARRRCHHQSVRARRFGGTARCDPTATGNYRGDRARVKSRSTYDRFPAVRISDRTKPAMPAGRKSPRHCSLCHPSPSSRSIPAATRLRSSASSRPRSNPSSSFARKTRFSRPSRSKARSTRRSARIASLPSCVRGSSMTFSARRNSRRSAARSTPHPARCWLSAPARPSFQRKPRASSTQTCRAGRYRRASEHIDAAISASKIAMPRQASSTGGILFEWRAADRLKQTLLHKIDFLLDTHLADTPKMVTGDAFRAALASTARRPFRVVPFFDPGPWGGQWMRETSTCPTGRPTMPGASTACRKRTACASRFGDPRFECPRSISCFYQPQELLGDAVYGRFGAEFPIRFDFLDTMGGGNLSLQVHPRTRYIREAVRHATRRTRAITCWTRRRTRRSISGLRTGIDPGADGGGLCGRAGRTAKPFPAERVREPLAGAEARPLPDPRRHDSLLRRGMRGAGDQRDTLHLHLQAVGLGPHRARRQAAPDPSRPWAQQTSDWSRAHATGCART